MTTQEENQLLLIDLSARLPYGVMIHIEETNESEELYCLNISQEGLYTRNKEHHNISSLCPIEQAKPYLRPIHKLTKEELEELEFLTDSDYVDYCNKHHIDYRNLIPKGLALEAPKVMYNINEK